METKDKKSAEEQERYTAALSYVWIIALYTFLFKRKSPFVRFHAKQGLALFVIETLSIITGPLMPIVTIVCVVASIWGIKSSLEGKHWQLPLIGDWLKKTDI